MPSVRSSVDRSHAKQRGGGIGFLLGAALVFVILGVGVAVWAMLNVVGVFHQFTTSETKCDKSHHLAYRTQPAGKTIILLPYCAAGSK